MTGAGRTIVVGAGISGLTAAEALQRGGRDVLVFDAADRPGGCIRTDMEDGRLFEWGPNSFPSTSRELCQLASRLGLDDSMLVADAAAAVRLLYHDHHLQPVPTNPRDLLGSRLFTWPQKLRILAEPFVPAARDDKPESVAHFFARRFGPAPTRTLVDAFVSGIYAADARRVGLRSAFPMLHDMEREHGSILKGLMARRKKDGSKAPMKLMSFRHGLGELTAALAGALERPVELGAKVRELTFDGSRYALSVERASGGVERLDADEVVLATPAPVTGMLLAHFHPMVSDLLFDVDYAGVIAIHACFAKEELPTLPSAFGFLAPRPSQLRTLGWLFTSRIFEGRAPEGFHTLSGFIGGAKDQAVLDAPEDAIRHIILGELSLALSMKRIPRPAFMRLVPHRPGLPQYTLGHERRIAAVKTLLDDFPKLRIIGNYVGGISMNDCVRTATAAAGELLAAPGPRPAAEESHDGRQ